MRPVLSQPRPRTTTCIIALGAAAATLFAGLFVRGLIVVREDARKQAEENAANLVRSVQREISHTIESFDLSIQGAIIAFRHPDFASATRSAQQLMLFDHAATASYLQSVTVLDANGDVLRDSRSETLKPTNLSARSDFLVHRDHADAGLFVGPPHPSRLNNLEVINLSRRITLPDGSFGGVVTGAMAVEYFRTLLSSLRLGPKGTATLILADGAVVATAPFGSETNPLASPAADLMGRLARERHGRFEVRADDGTSRIYNFAQVANLPLFVVLGIAESDIAAAWRPRAIRLTGVMGILAVMVVALAAMLARELRARRAAETKLAEAALVDPLTGVANRRAFDAEMAAVQAIGARTGRPVSLLMIDVDRFKQYNDAHGHVQGDAALGRIANLIASCCRKGDVVARYGGEEFAILLPDADLPVAFEVAERVRLAVAVAAIPYLSAAGRRVTVSVGVAQQRDGEGLSDVVSRADAALYRAKAKGRNCVVCAGDDRGSLDWTEMPVHRALEV